MIAKDFKFQQLINLSILAFGMQFVNSLQLSNMSSLYRFLGASNSYTAILALAAPLSGLIIQPIIGQLSDETFSVYGKRRPYIFGWTLLGAIACFFIAFTHSLWVALLLMWTLSCSNNGATEGLRALIGDIVSNAQKVNAFALQTVFSGVGAGLSAMLPYFYKKYISAHAQLPANTIPWSLKFSFIIGAFVWAICMYWTVTRVKEYIPKEHKALMSKIKSKRKSLFLIFIRIFQNIKKMPRIMKQLGIVQIFTWIAIFSVWLFFSVAISQHFYHLPFDANVIKNPAEAAILEKGTMQANFYISIYQGVSVIYALFLIYLGHKFSQKLIHAISLIIGAIGLISIGLISNPNIVIVSMIAVGIMWGSIITLPYSIIAVELPRNKMGVYFGLFNVTITVPQIVASFILDPIYIYIFRYHAIYIITLSGLLILTAGLFMLYWFGPKTMLTRARGKQSG